MTNRAGQLFAILFLFGLISVLAAQTVYPGLYYPDGSVHEIHTPNPVTGNTLNVVDFGADPLDNDSDDRPAIEAALRSANFGDEIYFPAGVYNFNSTPGGDSRTHLILKSGVNLRGDGPSKTVLKSAFGDKSIDRFLKMRGLHDIVISGLRLTVVFTGNYSTDTHLNNPDAGGPKYAISIEEDAGMPSYNITVDSVFVEHFRRHGVRLSNSHDVVVKNSVFKNATDVGPGGAGYGVSIQGDKKPDNNSKFNLVEGCRFIGPYIRHGVLLQYATHNNAVRNNYFIANRLDAIDLHGEDEYLNEIYANEIYDVLTGAGVGVGNTGSTHDASGPHNYIHDNVMVNCREGVKVYLGSPDTRIENNVITQSTVLYGKGIYLLNAPRTIVRGNKIYENPGTDFTGIYLKHDAGTNGKGAGDPEDIQILENKVYQNDYGIRIFAGRGIVLEDNDVHDNFKQDVYIASGVVLHKLLHVSVVGRGSVDLDPPGGSYAVGTVVRVTAKRYANWQFSHWEGDLSGTANPDSLVIDDSKKIVAVFEEKPNANEVMLIVNTQGAGHVELDPPGGIYERGSVVTITAIPDSGWKFEQWSGDITGDTTVVQVVLDRDIEITAHFAPLAAYRLMAWVVGSGHVELDPPGGTYPEGTEVTVTAVPDSGWQFVGWGGDLTGAQNPVTVRVQKNLTFTVTFKQISRVDAPALMVYDYRLEQNYPNPFNPITVIPFSIRQPGAVTLEIYDALGRKVETLLSGYLQAGRHSVRFNASRLPSGVYFYKLECNGYVAMKKMLLVR